MTQNELTQIFADQTTTTTATTTVDFSACVDLPDTTFSNQNTKALNGFWDDESVHDDWQSCRAFCKSKYPTTDFVRYVTEDDFRNEEAKFRRCTCKELDEGKRPSGKSGHVGVISAEVKCGGKRLIGYVHFQLVGMQ